MSGSGKAAGKAKARGAEKSGPGRFTGAGPLLLVWSGQAVSLVGSAVLRFAFIIEVWSTGEQATAVTALSLCALLPQALFSPFAGAIIDRIRKRSALQIADAGGLLTVGLLALVHFFGGGLEPWQVYPATVLLGISAAFQLPALTAAVPLLVRKDQLGRANGLLAGARSAAGICGPALGGVMVAVSGIGAVLIIDLVSYAFALIGIRVVRMKGDKVPAGAGAPRTRITAEAVEGLRYVFRQGSLRAMTVNFCTVNLVMVFGFAVIQPMVLIKDGNGALAAVNSAIGVGGVVGGLLMAAWGGPKNRGRGMMLGIVGMCLSAQIGMALVGGVVAWCAAILVGALLMTLVNSSMQAIVQTKVDPQWQGRVFGAVMFLSQISVPLATAVSGPLADGVFEPQADDGTGVFVLLGPLFGDDPGSGMAGMLFLAGVAGLAVALWGLASRSIRDIDVLLPDIDDENEQKADDGTDGRGGEKDDAVRA
ncbi:MFS transporter [Streptomyces alboniger]|uniref:MFS transporter n=1 Tax=Streptomyces alboniger TaxID=132473 RepID=A0A5J6HNT2_STRAD|nr:MFS transporter [Streptomyces alboniger]QEV20244.1 MFS transporter [Streptomyces alboniger]